MEIKIKLVEELVNSLGFVEVSLVIIFSSIPTLIYLIHEGDKLEGFGLFGFLINKIVQKIK